MQVTTRPKETGLTYDHMYDRGASLSNYAWAASCSFLYFLVSMDRFRLLHASMKAKTR